MKTMLQEVLGDVMVSVQGDVPLDDKDWGEFLATVAAHATSLKAFLISADNHGPNAGQRAKLANQRDVYPLPKAVVTTSMAVRGIVTATSWLGTNIRAFSPSHIDDAFEYLGVPQADRNLLVGRVALLKTRLAGGEAVVEFRGADNAYSTDLQLMQQIVEERVANIRTKLRAGPRPRF